MQYVLKMLKKTCDRCFTPDREEIWILQVRNKKSEIPVEMIGYTCKCGSQRVPEPFDLREYEEPTIPMFQ